MRAIVIEDVNKASIQELPDPVPAPGEVVVSVEARGLCGTEEHIYKGEFLSSYPLIPGHEFAGVITELGAGVEGWHVGDRVAVDPNISCHRCYFCQTERSNHCLNWRGIGVNVAGALAEKVAVPAENLYAIGDLNFEEAALIEPLSCVVYGLRRLQPAVGDEALIFGAGPIGLLHVQLLAHAGMHQVVVVDRIAQRLERARTLGATEVVLADGSLEQRLRQIAPLGFQIVVDATGVPVVVERALQFVKPAGKLLVFGVCPPQERISLSPFEVYRKDLQILGSFALRYTFHYARDLLASGVVQARPLISHVVGLGEGLAALTQPERFEKLKVVVRPGAR